MGTPFHHQGRLPFVGLDCIGLMVCAARHFRIPIEDCVSYGRNPNPRQLISEMEKNLVSVPIGDQIVGDVLLFWTRRPDMPRHVGIMTPYGMLHTYQSVGCVAEHKFVEPWVSRVHSVWRFRRPNG